MTGPPTLRTLMEQLPTFGERRAAGVRASFGTRWWTCTQLYCNSLYAAHLFQERSLRAGDRVVLYAPLCPEWIALFMGCVWRGLVVVPLDARASLNDLKATAKNSSAKLVVFTAGQAIDAIGCPLLRIDNLEAPRGLVLDAAELRVSVGNNDTAIEDASHDDGGRTLTATHAELLEQVDRMTQQCLLPGRVRRSAALVASLQANAGCIPAILFSLMAGEPVLFVESAAPHHVLRSADAIESGRLIASSALLHSLEELLVSRQASFRTVIVSDRGMRSQSREFWQRCGIRVVESTAASTTFTDHSQCDPIYLDDILKESDSPARAAKLVDYIESNFPDAPIATVREFVRTLPIESIEQAEVVALLLASSAIDIESALNAEDSIVVRSRWKHRAPDWQSSRVGSILRTIVSPIFRRFVLGIVLHGRVTGLNHLRDLSGPLFFALRRSDRRHPVEFLSVVKALPPRLGRRVMFGVSDRPFFESHFYRRPSDSWLYRLFVGSVALLGLPSVLPYVLFESGLSHGFEEMCSWVNRGYCPLVTWTPAMARLATEVQATIVPIRLRGQWNSWWNANVQVHFGVPRRTLPFANADFTYLDIEGGFRDALPEVEA